MLTAIARRLVTSAITLFVCSILIFGYRYLIPGGPAADIADLDQLSSTMTRAQLARQVQVLSRRFGLDKPIYAQYLSWLGGVLHGHLGTSFYSQAPVTTVIAQRMAPSFELIIGAMVVSLAVGVPLGMYSAVRRERIIGRTVLALSGLQISVPDFWLATINAAIFGLVLHWFPAVGFVPLSAGLGANLHAMVLPILTLAIVPTAFVVRHLHNSMAQVLRSAYVRTCWAMGLPSRQVYFNCALRNALGPIITLIPLLIASLLGGTVLVEYIFNIPGLGTAIVTAVENQDYPMTQGLVLLAGVIVAVFNLLADLTLSVLDPRVRKGSARTSVAWWRLGARRAQPDGGLLGVPGIAERAEVREDVG
jgi:peptide/nickel transport system permease protein